MPLPAGAVTVPNVPLWTARYTSSSSLSVPVAIVASPAGERVFVTGYSYGFGTGSDYGTAAYSSRTGEELWSARRDWTNGSRDEPTAIAISPDGSTLFVTGFVAVPSEGSSSATIAYDAATGETLWETRSSAGRAEDLVVSPDGSRVVVNTVGWGSGFLENVTVAFDAATGGELWTARARTGGYGSPRIAADGKSVYVLGYLTPFWPDLAAYDLATGAGLWTADYDGSGVDIVVDQAGSSVFVAGQSAGDFSTVAYDAATGATRWTSRFSGPTVGNWSGDYPTSIAVDPSGSHLFVTGYSAGDSAGYATVAIDARAGAVVWVSRYSSFKPVSIPLLNSSERDVPSAVAVSPDGTQVFVTGESWGYEGPDYLTIGYEASTGEAMWLARHAALGDGATGLAVGSDGSSVFVTGYGERATGQGDYVTLAYAADPIGVVESVYDLAGLSASGGSPTRWEG